MNKHKYCYIIGEDLQLYKLRTETINKLLEFAISPLSIKYEIDNKDVKELLKTLEKELEKEEV